LIFLYILYPVLYRSFGLRRLNLWYYYLRQGGYVFIGVCLFVCLILSRTVQKLLDRLSHNSMERWHTTKEETIRFSW